MSALTPQSGQTIEIRQAESADLEAIANLWVELISFHARLDPHFRVPTNGHAKYYRHAANALRDDSFCVLVAVAERRIIGYAMGYIGQNPPIFPTPRFGFIADLCVTADARRCGIGTQLVQQICTWFREQGMESIQLNVAYCNPVSQAFWRKIGCQDYLCHMWLDLGR